MTDKTEVKKSPEPFIKDLTILPERVSSFETYPFSIPAIRQLSQLDFHPKVTFFAGENGSGKSTLLEAIAILQGLNPEGGSRNFNFATRESHSNLARCLRLGRGMRALRNSDAFFFRAESFYNVATEAERIGMVYGDKSLHEQSHGESFMALILNRFSGNGLYLLDEPEAALSPSRQLSFLAAIYQLVENGSQFVIATQSPILLGYPDCTICWFSNSGIAPIGYTDTEHYKVTKAFLTRRESMLQELLGEGGE
jgi:predicted ATPase